MTANDPKRTLRVAIFRTPFLLAILLATYGCATPDRCAEQQFFKAFVGEKANPNRYFPEVAQLELHKDVALGVSICGNGGKAALCVETFPSDGIPFQFLGTGVTVSSRVADARAEVPFEKITYNVLCHGPTLDWKDAKCESPIESPAGDEVERKRTRIRTSKIGSEYFYLDDFELPPSASFKGAMVSVNFLKTIHRKYVAITQPFEASKADDILVTVPKVRIGAQTLDVPQVTFKYVTENVCLPNRPRSLQ